jgi:hypothetical protein
MVVTSAVFLSGVIAIAGFPQSAGSSPQAPATSSPNPAPARHSASPYHTTSLTTHAANRYESIWGIDALEVKSVESGQLIRFGYRILDIAKAAQLNDKKATPVLIDERAGVSLQVPTMENAGQLRQSSTPEAGRSYWMVFSNKGKIVKPGDRVKIVIGQFHADGLFVR